MHSLRETSLAQEKGFQKRAQLLETDTRPDAELRIENEQLKKDIAEYEGQNKELKESLDDALGASELIEQLSQKNIEISQVTAIHCLTRFSNFLRCAKALILWRF